jgi:hypothetical protein
MFLFVGLVIVADRRADRRCHRAGGGYTPLAMVAETHPIHHPAKITATMWRMCLLSTAATTARRMAQTMAQQMLYAV